MKVVFKCLVAVVILAPLAFGADFMWTWSLIGLVVAVLLLSWAILLWRGDSLAVPPRRIWPALVLFTLVIAWAFIQMVGWTPASWHHPLWAFTAQALGRPLEGRISLNPSAGASVVLRFLMYAGIFWLALQLCRDRERARQGVQAFAIAGALYAGYGILVKLSGTNTILWFPKYAYFNVVTSTFINRNSYATFAGLGLLATTALLDQVIREAVDTGKGLRFALHTALSQVLSRRWYLVAGWLALVAALLLSESRGGFISTVVGLITFFLARSLGSSAPKARLVQGGVGALLVGVIVMVMAGGPFLDRLSKTLGQTDIRGQIYARTVAAIEDAPILGTGLGTFEDTFRMYRTSDLGATVAAAHNTYLENMLELGIPAAAALFLIFGYLGFLCAVGTVVRRRDRIYPCLGLGSVVLIGTHSLVDFSMQIPADAVAACFLIGLGTSQSWNSDNGPYRSSRRSSLS